jgi:hypothetical protein
MMRASGNNYMEETAEDAVDLERQRLVTETEVAEKTMYLKRDFEGISLFYNIMAWNVLEITLPAVVCIPGIE